MDSRGQKTSLETAPGNWKSGDIKHYFDIFNSIAIREKTSMVYTLGYIDVDISFPLDLF
jgi:hypothetical protein